MVTIHSLLRHRKLWSARSLVDLPGGLCYNRDMPSRLSALSANPRLKDLGALALLVAISLVTCGFLLRNDLFLYGDHPGQFMRLWYPLRVSGRLLGWNPLWYAGYPELQFYPPGFVLLGWALDVLTLRHLPAVALYQLLVFLAYLLPGITVYALIVTVSGSRFAALVCGVLALLFAELWGGATSVFVGLVAERLAFGLAPLVLLAGWKALHAARPLIWWLATGLALAATVLMHPFHALAPVLFLTFAALLLPRRWANLRDLALATFMSLGLVAFWLLPLMAHNSYAAPMLRANLAQTLDWLFKPSVRSYLWAGLLIPFALLAVRRRAFAAFVGSAWATILVLVALVLLDHLVLIDRLGFYVLDPVRFLAEVYLFLVLLAGLGLAYLPLWATHTRWRLPGRVLGGLALAASLVWLGQPWLSLVRSQGGSGEMLSQARQRFPLDAAQQALQPGEGRVLFTSYYLNLGEIPTSLKAMTPYFTGRPIVGGTFSHWSPVARALWVGRTDVDLLPDRVELTDDVSLGGRAWAEWTDTAFFDLCHRLYVTTIATTWDDWNARTFLDAAPHFQSYYSDDLFVLYRVLDPAPGLVEADHATASLVEAGPTALRVHVADAAPGAVLHLRITDYPLWQVAVGEGTLPHYPDDLGLMTVPLPPGTYDLSLRYRPGFAERLGAWISLGTALLALAVLAYLGIAASSRYAGRG
jgi:hypothetical protein